TPQSTPVPFQVLSDRPKQMRGGGETVSFGQYARRGIRRRHALLAAPALGDVFARDQDDHVIARPADGLSIFANPEHGAVLADFSDLPAMGTADFFYAGRQLIFDDLSVLLEKYVQHRFSDQLDRKSTRLNSSHSQISY